MQEVEVLPRISIWFYSTRFHKKKNIEMKIQKRREGEEEGTTVIIETSGGKEVVRHWDLTALKPKKLINEVRNGNQKPISINWWAVD